MSEGAENWYLNFKLSAYTHPGANGLDSSTRGGDPSLTRPSSLVVAPIDLSSVTRETWVNRGSAYGYQDNSYLSALAGVDNFYVGEAVGGVKAKENPPPPQPTLTTKEGGIAKSSDHPGSLREGGWENVVTGHRSPLPNTTAYPRGVPQEKFQKGPVDAYLPGGKPLEKISPHLPPPRRNPCDQVRESHFSN